MSSLLSDPSNSPVLIALAVLIGLFLFALRSMIGAPSRHSRSMEATAKELLGALSGSERARATPAVDLERQFRAQILGRHGDRWILGKPLRTIVEEWAERTRTDSPGYIVGGSYTGFALVMTFGLIAYVLFTDVATAIQASGSNLAPESGTAAGGAGAAALAAASTAGSEALAAAVAKMGSKFLISSAGLVFALANAFVVKWSEARWARVADALAERLTPSFIEVREAQLELMKESIAASKEVGATVTDRLDRLRAIEVSVKDLGAEVTANLNSLVQDALASQLRQLMEDTRNIAAAIAAQMEQTLRGNFEELAGRLVGALQNVQTALERQSGSEVEKLLARLQDAVSGGFSSETRNMSKLLTDFQAVFPELARELQAVSGTMSRVLEGLEHQQREQKAMVEGMTAATSESVQRLSLDLAKGGTEAMGRVLAETNARIDRMVEALDVAAQKNSGQAVSLAAEFDQIAARVDTVTQGLNGSMGNVQALMKNVESTLASSAAGVQQLSSAVSQLRGAADGVQRSLSLSDQVRTSIEQSLRDQVELASKNVKGLEHMQDVWPRLLEEVTKAVQTTTGQFTSSWTTLAGKLESATSIYGTQVGERVETLSEAVEKLGRHLQATSGQRR